MSPIPLLDRCCTNVETRGSKFDRALKYALAEAERLGDLAELAEPVRTVVLVHAAQGIIDNGGLPYFFEADFPGRPSYSVFADAYRAIGAEDEARVLADAVRLFPFATPHRFRARREKFLDQFTDDGSHRPDSPFEPLTNKLCGNESVWRRLEAYVERHGESFPT